MCNVEDCAFDKIVSVSGMKHDKSDLVVSQWFVDCLCGLSIGLYKSRERCGWIRLLSNSPSSA